MLLYFVDVRESLLKSPMLFQGLISGKASGGQSKTKIRSKFGNILTASPLRIKLINAIKGEGRRLLLFWGEGTNYHQLSQTSALHRSYSGAVFRVLSVF